MSLEHVSSAALTDQGRKRQTNQDSFLEMKTAGVFCVADGMGGGREGNIASRAITSNLAVRLRRLEEEGVWPELSALARIVRGSIAEANTWIYEHAQEKGFSSMGSTVVVFMLDHYAYNRGVVLHAGDSVLFRLRGNALTRLTADHSVSGVTGIKAERLPKELRSVVTKAIGVRAKVVLDRTDVDVAPGDIFLLCTDGLTRMVPEKQIRKLLTGQTHSDMATAAESLVGRANDAGGEDNTTVVLVSVDEQRAPPPPLPEVDESLEPEDTAEATLPGASPSSEDTPTSASTSTDSSSEGKSDSEDSPVTPETQPLEAVPTKTDGPSRAAIPSQQFAPEKEGGTVSAPPPHALAQESKELRVKWVCWARWFGLVMAVAAASVILVRVSSRKATLPCMQPPKTAVRSNANVRTGLGSPNTRTAELAPGHEKTNTSDLGQVLRPQETATTPASKDLMPLFGQPIVPQTSEVVVHRAVDSRGAHTEDVPAISNMTVAEGQTAATVSTTKPPAEAMAKSGNWPEEQVSTAERNSTHLAPEQPKPAPGSRHEAMVANTAPQEDLSNHAQSEGQLQKTRLAEARLAIPGHMAAALQSGEWGKLASWLESLGVATNTIMGANELTEYERWIAAWRQIEGRRASVSAEWAALTNGVPPSLVADVEFSVPIRWPDEAARSADEYCRALHALRLALVAGIQKRVAAERQNLATYGDEPLATISNLCSLAALTPAETATAIGGFHRAMAETSNFVAQAGQLTTVNTPLSVSDLALVGSCAAAHSYSEVLYGLVRLHVADMVREGQSRYNLADTPSADALACLSSLSACARDIAAGLRATSGSASEHETKRALLAKLIESANALQRFLPSRR